MQKMPMIAKSNSESAAAVDAWARLLRVSRVLLEHVEADLKDAGFPPLSWYDALLELRRAGRRGLRPFELQQRMLLAQYNVSRLVDRLVAADYAERRPSADDGRGQVLTVTREGRALLRRMWPAYGAAIERHFASRLASEEIATLALLLRRLRD